ncbi:MAG: hypothetical protein ACI9EW_000876 [Cellvibrionaceae bacterium]|jgi:hypothetical protein
MEQLLHPFDSALELTKENNHFHGRTSPAYANMIGPFGGITAAAMLKAVIEHPEVQGEPLTLTVNFAAAVKDGDYQIEAQAVRTGRSTQHWFVSMIQGDEVVTTATAIFATRRETWGATDLAFPSLPAEAKPISTKMMPPWAKNYQFRMMSEMADLIMADQPKAETLQSIQDDPPRPLDFLSLTAMADVFPPRVMIRRAKFVPMGTVAFTVYFHVNSATLAAHGDGELIGHAQANRYYNQYADQSAELWTPAGDLLVTSTQIVYFKE